MMLMSEDSWRGVKKKKKDTGRRFCPAIIGGKEGEGNQPPFDWALRFLRATPFQSFSRSMSRIVPHYRSLWRMFLFICIHFFCIYTSIKILFSLDVDFERIIIRCVRVNFYNRGGAHQRLEISIAPRDWNKQIQTHTQLYVRWWCVCCCLRLLLLLCMPLSVFEEMTPYCKSLWGDDRDLLILLSLSLSIGRRCRRPPPPLPTAAESMSQTDTHTWLGACSLLLQQHFAQ